MLSNVRSDIQEYLAVDIAGLHEIPEEKQYRFLVCAIVEDMLIEQIPHVAFVAQAEKVRREVKILSVAAP
jgi:hypothetical protein